MTEADKRAAIVDMVVHLENIGLNHGSSGNISMMHDGRVLITPAGGRKATLTPAGIVTIDMAGETVGADQGVPSTEWRLHTEIYRARPEVQAVVHSHADSCVALSCLRQPMPPFHYMVASFGGDEIPCSRYEAFGSDALADAVVEALQDRYKACLMASHGMIAVGTSLGQAVDLTIKLETLARQFILARQAGVPVLLNAAELAEVHRRYPFYGKSRLPR